MSDWKRYPAHPLWPKSKCFYQKRSYDDGTYKISANLVEYGDYLKQKGSFTLDIQIPEEISPIGRTINVTVFPYPNTATIPFGQAEDDAAEIIKRLLRA